MMNEKLYETERLDLEEYEPLQELSPEEAQALDLSPNSQKIQIKEAVEEEIKPEDEFSNYVQEAIKIISADMSIPKIFDILKAQYPDYPLSYDGFRQKMSRGKLLFRDFVVLSVCAGYELNIDKED